MASGSVEKEGVLIKGIFLMYFESGNIYHVFNRGNNKQKIFFTDKNYLFFLEKIRKHILPHAEILAYCLMPNHFHLLLLIKGSRQNASSGQTGNINSSKEHHPLVKEIAVILSSYSQAINKQENRTGSLFQQKTKAICLNDVVSNSKDSLAHLYPAIGFHYIHQNPMTAGLVSKMEEWSYSSFKDYAGLRNGTLCNKALAFETLDLPKDQKEFYKLSYDVINENVIDKISNFE